MHIITLTSDWNNDDFYVGALKGRILSQCKDALIVDLNHRIKPFHTAQAAFIVRNSYRRFPEGSIHLIAVNTEPEPGGQLLAATLHGHFFLCADNGMLGLLGGSEPEKVVSLSREKIASLSRDTDSGESTFLSLTILADAACAISRGQAIESLGQLTSGYSSQTPLRPAIEGDTISGSVVYIDSYQNAITNVSAELFKRVGKGRDFTIYVQSKHYRIQRIRTRYNEVPPGELLALFNSIHLLEIAIRNGNAAGLLKLNTNSTIRIEFNNR